MAIGKFFSVERIGYTRVSDLFLDVLADMTNNGFHLINCSHAEKAGQPNAGEIVALKCTVIGTPLTPQAVAKGERLILDPTSTALTPPLFSGSPRAPLYVYVNAISGAPGHEVATVVSDVRSDFDTGVTTGYDISEISSQLTAGDPPITVDLYKENITTHLADPTKKVATISIEKFSTPITQNAAVANSNIIDQLSGLSSSHNPDSFSFTMEATGDVDPLNDPAVQQLPSDRQPWRVQFVVPDEQKAAGSVATGLQMTYDPNAAKVTISKITDDTGAIIDNVGSIGATQPGGVFSNTDVNQGFYNRKVRVANQAVTYPLTYRLTITDRGFFLGIWEGSWSTQRAAATANSNYFNWVLVQRPVDRNTGVTLVQGKAPVFMVNGVNYTYYKLVVREADILHPTAPVAADANSDDSSMLFNSKNQVALTEDKTYLLTFPHNLTTPRFRYTEELDLIGTTSADVVMASQEIQFRTYGERGARTYAALPPSGQYNTGLRLAVMAAPQGPWWDDQPGGTYGDPANAIPADPLRTINDPFPLGSIQAGDTVLPTTQVYAFPITDLDGTQRQLPTYSIIRGEAVLNKLGIVFDPTAATFSIPGGTIAAADYSQTTDIKFTINAINVEDIGYTSKDFYFTYQPV